MKQILRANEKISRSAAIGSGELLSDSLDLIEMVMELEVQAQISISDEELNDLNNTLRALEIILK